MSVEEIDKMIEKLDNTGAIEFACGAFGNWFAATIAIAIISTFCLVLSFTAIFLYLTLVCWFLACFMIFISWKALQNEKNGKYVYCF
jgi:hypothetical protein